MIEFLEIAKSVKYMFQAMVTILIDKHVHPRSSTQHYRKKYKPKKGRKTNKQTNKQVNKHLKRQTYNNLDTPRAISMFLNIQFVRGATDSLKCFVFPEEPKFDISARFNSRFR